jgi:hypothetical protein
VWTNEGNSKEGLQGILCPLTKKGDQLECNTRNYRGITLLSVTYKVFSTILYTRLLPHVESKLGHYQAGFPKKVIDKADFWIVTNFGKDERI